MSTFIWMTLGQLFAKDRNPVRRRLGWKGRLLRLVVLTALAGLAYGAYYTAESGALRVQTVSVQGVSYLKPEQVVSASGLSGRSIVMLDSRAYESRLESLPFVLTAEVQSGLSTKVRVVIRERTPSAIVQTGSGAWLVDETGLVLDQARGAQRVPILEVERAAPLRPGDRISKRQTAFVLSLYSQLAADVRPVVEKVRYTEARGYEIISSAGWTAIIGSDTSVGVKVEVLRQVLRRKGVRLVDVSVPTTPYYRVGTS